MVVEPIGYSDSELAMGSASIHMTQLPNYLRSNRKRLGLSQEEVAFLLGNKNGTQVCRYERFDRKPNLETALAFEVIFKRSPSELFGGIYQKVERDVAARAKTLSETTGGHQNARKREMLSSLANTFTN